MTATIISVLFFFIIGAMGIASMQDAWKPIYNYLKPNYTRFIKAISIEYAQIKVEIESYK
jgi:hypothetical protein